MKIFFHKGNIHLEDFGGKNFVIPDKSEGELVLETLKLAIDSQAELLSSEFPSVGDLRDLLGDCPAGTNWASRPEYQSREA